jgi:RNA polymerase sigma factor (sigma-70 family)
MSPVKGFPSELESITNMPGASWSSEDRITIKKWLVKNRLTYLIYFASIHLGYNTTPEDAEDVCSYLINTQLDRIIDSFDPNKENARHFWNYLKKCFERECHRKGECIRNRRRQEEPIERPVETDDGDYYEITISDPHPRSNPEKNLLRKEFRMIFNQCLNSLSVKYRIVFILCYIEEISTKETSFRLQIPLGTILTRCYRARNLLADCITSKGYGP